MLPHLSDGPPFDPDFAGVGGVHAGEHFHERGLPGPVLAEQDVHDLVTFLESL